MKNLLKNKKMAASNEAAIFYASNEPISFKQNFG
ncbi:hypothetical protein SAMN05421542_0579 [Chryseobacterium jejuense]|uniref:Uncharacterized protein n=1 Tax=Chryseobacterium jejuense TaxID=445960 RepID=A0A2X2VCK0_CHRJE|nr:hypothetical protein SAMN05421542_0579 [Chryseobacterium jejuense]SQB26686.1 Uncharacterised protein [Chryseobacterium jejuense]